MNRLTQLFQRKKEQILSLYITAGFPEINSLSEILIACEEAGVDMIEVGIPYSDPLADGPTIQQSSERALRNGMTLQQVIDQVGALRSKVTFPILLMGYLNPVLQFGVDEFCEKAHAAGVDGLILPDLPLPEYERFFQRKMQECDLGSVFLFTKDTSAERLAEIDAATTGFLYAVSMPSITGGTSRMVDGDLDHLKRLQTMNLKNSVLIGFGIHDKRTFENACRFANGAIVGSAFIRAVETGPRECRPTAELVGDFVATVR